MDLEWRCESLGCDGTSHVRRLRAVAMDALRLGLRRESSQEQRAAGGIREGDKRLQAAAGSNRSAGAARAPQTGRLLQRTLGGRRADMLSRG